MLAKLFSFGIFHEYTTSSQTLRILCIIDNILRSMKIVSETVAVYAIYFNAVFPRHVAAAMSREMSSGGRIKVDNPVVDLDGDEMTRYGLQYYLPFLGAESLLFSFLSPCSKFASVSASVYLRYSRRWR